MRAFPISLVIIGGVLLAASIATAQTPDRTPDNFREVAPFGRPDAGVGSGNYGSGFNQQLQPGPLNGVSPNPFPSSAGPQTNTPGNPDVSKNPFPSSDSVQQQSPTPNSQTTSPNPFPSSSTNNVQQQQPQTPPIPGADNSTPNDTSSVSGTASPSAGTAAGRRTNPSPARARPATPAPAK